MERSISAEIQPCSFELQYINSDLMESIDVHAFQSQYPYPWTNPIGFLRQEALEKLTLELPDVSKFTPSFGYERKYGQQSHDRFVLDYTESLDLPESWREFIAELRGDQYRNFVCRLFGIRAVNLSFQWHYTPRAASVSPHVDSRRKVGSQIFYMNTADDWLPEWGGQTLLLDDRGQFERGSSPSIESFHAYRESSIEPNSSLIFAQNGKSWHAVRSLECPDGYFRKVFIVRYERSRPIKRFRKRFTGLFRGQPDQERTVF